MNTAQALATGMKKSKVIEILEYYTEIDGEIKVYRSIVEDLEQNYNPLAAMQYDGQPKGKYNISQQTENIALNIPDYVREDIKYYQNKIDSLQKLKVEILKEVSRLKLHQKNIIFGFYFNGLKWEQVAVRNHYSERQCKNIRDLAVESLSQKFSNNGTIANYELTA